MQNIYAQALYSASQKDSADPKKLVAQLVKYLQASGRSKLLPSILKDLERIEAREAKLAPVVEVAHENEAAAALKHAATLGIHTTKAQVNPALIQGWRATGNGKLYDQSAKRSLVELYRNVTT
jgi:F0F1-type ATP synthase delta subunit